MAQRTGAERFIASRASVASARVILALAASAALALAGCGGGGDSDATTAGAPSAPAKEGTASGPEGEAKATGESPSSAGKAQGNSNQPPSSPSAASPGEGKKGPHIAPPKGPPEPAPTPTQRAEATVADMVLESPDFQPAEGSAAVLAATNTCDGTDTSPALEWQGVPPGTRELALFAMSLQPVDGKLFFNWALAGIDPSLQSLQAGRTPKGAISGRNSFGKNGYSVCPPRGQSETFIFALYALPKSLSPHKGFDPTALREAALDASGNAGLVAATYARG